MVLLSPNYNHKHHSHVVMIVKKKTLLLLQYNLNATYELPNLSLHLKMVYIFSRNIKFKYNKKAFWRPKHLDINYVYF